MARSKLISRLDSKQPVFIGLDVHKNKWSVSVIHQDEIIEEHTIPGTYQALASLLNKYKEFQVISAYEAGFLGFYLHHYLEADGIKNLVIAPNRIPTETGNYIKTDKRDARKIAFSLSKNLLTSIYIPSKEQSDLRQILRSREKIIRIKRTILNRIKMLLHQFEIKFTASGLTKAEVEKIRNLELPENTSFTLNLYLEQLELVHKQIASLLNRAHTMVQRSEYATTYQIIRTVPGVGPITAGMLAFEIGDFNRFSSGKKLAAYIGITPREFSSGDKVYKGRITGQGNKIIRSCIIEASWLLIGKDPVMKDYYNKIKSNSGSGKKAIVAVGRKLINRIHSIVINNQCYAIGEIN